MAAIGMGKYFAVLSQLPAEAVISGFAEYDRLPDSQYFPRPGKLLALCDPFAAKLRIAAGRAQMAANRTPTKVAEKTPEELAAERQALIDAGHMTPDGKMAPLNFKRTLDPAPAPLQTRKAAPSVGAVLANDPHLQALRANPIRRAPDESELF